MLCSTTSTPAARARAASSAAGNSYGYWYSTARKPARAAAAKRSRNGISLNRVDRLAASLGIIASINKMLETCPWWFWVVALFAVTFLLGVLSVVAGIGGGVLFVPI